MAEQTKALLLTTSEAADVVNWAKSMMAHDEPSVTLGDLAKAMDGLDQLYLAYERILTSPPQSRPISPPSPAETPTNTDFHESMDAREWARAFMERFKDRKDQIDEADMLAWFANAIMRGFDTARARYESPPTETQTATPEPTPTIQELQRINQSRSNRWMAGSPGWTTLEIAGELAGEVGELANVCKKLRRSEMGVRGNKLTDAELLEQARGECGDVFIVLMLTASKLGIDLYDATREAFNKKSEQMGFPERFGSPRAAQPATTQLTDAERIDWWEAHMPTAIYWTGRGGSISQGMTFRRFTDAARDGWRE